MRIRNLFPLFLLFTLLGCSFPGEALPSFLPTLAVPLEPPTLAPLPAATISPATGTPLPALIPTETLTPIKIPLTILPTYLEFPTITPSPTLDLSSRIQLRIVTPGPMSKVVSPIQLVVHIDPYYVGLTRIELLGEDGRELYRKVFKTYSNIGYFSRVDEKINFELKAAAETGRLQISTYDSKGNMLAFNSVRLLLLSVGDNQLSPSYPAQERVGLRYPESGTEVLGGTLPLTGEINPINDTPIIIELFDQEGHIIGSRLLQLAPADGKYQQFTTTIPYQVNKRLPARLVIRQSDDRISGLAYFYSLELFVNP